MGMLWTANAAGFVVGTVPVFASHYALWLMRPYTLNPSPNPVPWPWGLIPQPFTPYPLL